MSAAEKLHFTNKMESDPSFVEEVNNQQLVNNLISIKDCLISRKNYSLLMLVRKRVMVSGGSFIPAF